MTQIVELGVRKNCDRYYRYVNRAYASYLDMTRT